MFDRELRKHDLNPLIRLSGGYLVDDSDPEASLFINVCRDLGLALGGHASRHSKETLRPCPPTCTLHGRSFVLLRSPCRKFLSYGCSLDILPPGRPLGPADPIKLHVLALQAAVCMH